MMELPVNPANEVDSREALVAHILDLRADLLDRSDEWEIPTLEQYLEALAAWIESSPNWYRNFGQEMPIDDDWTFLARALSAAKVYV
ncbi:MULTISPECIES: DUF7660 family protein [Streptomyces]|uniref:DUF7660 family protein n=1 Tax=Streptomyces TaxID=1883 RepID=UPI0018DFBC7D|nr:MULTISPECIES: hypothetical protein [Streptomyces]MCZ4124870.1 hypothetical protein [Streptomyces sp. H39-S7]